MRTNIPTEYRHLGFTLARNIGRFHWSIRRQGAHTTGWHISTNLGFSEVARAERKIDGFLYMDIHAFRHRFNFHINGGES